MSTKQDLINKVINLYFQDRLDFINTDDGSRLIEWGGSSAPSWRTTMDDRVARDLWVRDIRYAIHAASRYVPCWDGMTIAGLKSLITHGLTIAQAVKS